MRISVCMVTYNHEPFIARAIESVLSQSFTDYELIICDDGSTDRTWEIIRTFRDKRIRAYRTTHNRGMIKNFSMAIRHCRGEYIAFLDGDDFWIDKRKLSVDLERIKGYDMVHSGCYTLRDDKITYDRPDFNDIMVRNCVSTSTAMIKSKIAKSVKFAPHWKMADYALWLACDTINYREDMTAVHRIHDGSISKGGLIYRWSFLKTANEIRKQYGGRSQYWPFIRLILSYVKKTCCN